MSGWRGNYIRAFIGIAGIAFLSAGMITSQFLSDGLNIGNLFIGLGIVLLAIVAYLWYKDFQQKG